MRRIILSQFALAVLAAVLAKWVKLDVFFLFLSSLGLALYFSLKFLWQYRQFFRFAAIANKVEMPAAGNFSQAQSILLVLGNFVVVGLLFYYPTVAGKEELLTPMLILYTLHLFVFMLSVRVWEKSTAVLFPVMK